MSSDRTEGEAFYKTYLLLERDIEFEWQQEIERLSIDELFDIVKKRYMDTDSGCLSEREKILKSEICKCAEQEIRKRAEANQGRKSKYHILGELICKSFNYNNMFPEEHPGREIELVDWIRERYAYLYANLIDDDFKTECQSALDMIDLDAKLKTKLKAVYKSLQKKEVTHTCKKTKKLEAQMLQYLGEVLSVYDNTFFNQDPPEEKEKNINMKYKEQHRFVRDIW